MPELRYNFIINFKMQTLFGIDFLDRIKLSYHHHIHFVSVLLLSLYHDYGIRKSAKFVDLFKFQPAYSFSFL